MYTHWAASHSILDTPCAHEELIALEANKRPANQIDVAAE